MKYKNWLVGVLLIVTGALTSNAILVVQGVSAVVVEAKSVDHEAE